MAIVANSLVVNGTVTVASSYDTASITPTANAQVILLVASFDASGGIAPAVSGNSLTWTQVGTTQIYQSPFCGTSLFKASGASPTASAVTMNFGRNQTVVAWSVVEFTGLTAGSSVVQFATGVADSGTTALATLASFKAGANITYGGISRRESGGSAGLTVGSGFTSINSFDGHLAVGLSLLAEWKNSNDLTVDATLASDDRWADFGLEIGLATAASSGGGIPLLRHRNRR